MISACSAGQGQISGHSKVSMTDVAMGTVVNVTVYPGKDFEKDEGETLLQEIFQGISDLETKTLSRRLETAEVWQINHHAGEDEFKTSKELLDVLRQCKELTADSEGVFDVTIGPLTTLWNVDELAQKEEAAALPREEEIRTAMLFCGMEKIKFSDDGVRLEDGMVLDLGSIGKGIALDWIRQRLDEQKELAGIFSLGGSILTYGEKPDGSPWRVAVTDPLNPSGTIGTLKLNGTWCVSTSGDYERFFEVDGIRYHHILDPSTGRPARSGLRSVTILSKSGFLSDALSTACFVLGKEEGMALARKLGAEILTVDEAGEIAMSEGFEQVFAAGE